MQLLELYPRSPKSEIPGVRSINLYFNTVLDTTLCIIARWHLFPFLVCTQLEDRDSVLSAMPRTEEDRESTHKLLLNRS